MFGTITAFAEGTAAAASQQATGPAAMISAFLPMIIVIVLLYFMMIRPQKKRDKEVRDMQNALKVGDQVVTIGGLVGKVAKIKDEYFYLETGMPGVSEKSYIKMERSAIKEVTKKAESKKKAAVEPVEEEADETNIDE